MTITRIAYIRCYNETGNRSNHDIFNHPPLSYDGYFHKNVLFFVKFTVYYSLSLCSLFKRAIKTSYIRHIINIFLIRMFRFPQFHVRDELGFHDLLRTCKTMNTR